MRIYHREGAGRPIRVVWALEEAGLPYDLTVLTVDEAQTDEHRERHPLNRVPVIETPTNMLFESTALCLHVAELRPEAGLAPLPGSEERALVYQWMFFAMTEIEPPLTEVYLARMAGEEAGAGVERCQKAIDVLEAALEGSEYLVGDRFSVADIVVGEVVGYVEPVAAATLGLNVTAYLERLAERPARQRAQARLAG